MRSTQQQQKEKKYSNFIQNFLSFLYFPLFILNVDFNVVLHQFSPDFMKQTLDEEVI